MIVQIIDTGTGKKEKIEVPTIDRFFPYLKEDTKIVKDEIYASFPTGYVSLGKEQIGSGGQLLVDDRDRKYSENLYARYDDSGHDNTKPHLNFQLIVRDHQTKRKEEIELKKDIHLINYDTHPKAIHIVICSELTKKCVIQPIVLLPTKEDKEYLEKQQAFLKKLKERRLTKEDEIRWKEEFRSYSDSLKKREGANITGKEPSGKL